jgi:glycine/D-amino acid oxidase-like deaminating enzyme/nitrite reductase/ring-hydroxylating ferredoxin subunit
MIQRDGARTSLWQDSVPYYTGKNTPDDRSYDVAIVGGGITGITTALLLQEAGKKCIVFEAQTLCYGTTSGTTAHLNTLVDTQYNTIIKNFSKEDAKRVANATREAIGLVKQNILKYSIECGFEDAPGYLYSQNEDQTKELQDIYDACLEVGLEVAYTDEIPVPIPFEQALKVENQAKFNPVEYVYALAEAFENAGGVIIQHCRVQNAEGDDRIDIETSKGNYDAGAIVYATHIPMGVNLLHLRCTPYRSYAMAVLLKNENEYPEALAYDMYEPYHYYRTQIVHGEPYLIAGGEDHKTAHEENTDQCFRKLEAHIRKHFDVQQIAYSWSSQFYESADGLPYIGHLPGHPHQIFVATGFGGNGMTYSHVAAALLKNMILGEKSEYEQVFDPNRIKPVAGFVNFIKQNADVAKELFSKLIPADKLGSLAELAPGEGRVVRFEGETIGLYKDEHGDLHAIDPVCTHLKCNVQWNGAEQSWDCPCHGARFSCDGKVLNGPADRDLALIEIRSLEETH